MTEAPPNITTDDLERFKHCQRLAYDCVTDVESRLEEGMTELVEQNQREHPEPGAGREAEPGQQNESDRHAPVRPDRDPLPAEEGEVTAVKHRSWLPLGEGRQRAC